MTLGPVRYDITREIWGDGDTVLLVFAGAAAEFALNRAVDWLFFTGALPREPLPRLFRTVGYAQRIAFASPSGAAHTLERIRQVHASVERQRGQSIPAWAHRAVLYMLIDYSERAGHLLRGPLGVARQEALYADFRRIGLGLGIAELPLTYAAWKADRARRLTEDLAWSPLTATLYDAYQHHLGPVRFELLRRIQAVLVPSEVRQMLRLPPPAAGSGLLAVWRAIRALRLGLAARRLVVPPAHWHDLGELERPPGRSRCAGGLMNTSSAGLLGSAWLSQQPVPAQGPPEDPNQNGSECSEKRAGTQPRRLAGVGRQYQ